MTDTSSFDDSGGSSLWSAPINAFNSFANSVFGGSTATSTPDASTLSSDTSQNFGAPASDVSSSGASATPDFAFGFPNPSGSVGTQGGSSATFAPALAQGASGNPFLSFGASPSQPFSSTTSAAGGSSFSPTTDSLAATGGSAYPSANSAQLTSPNAAPGASSPSTWQSILSTLGIGGGSGSSTGAAGGSSAGSIMSDLKPLVAGGGLLYDLLAGSPTSGAETSVKNLANSQSAQGQQLESYINNGTLPPGAQQWVNQQTAAQQASIRSKYAQLGMTGSTAETQELNNVQENATSQMFQIASSLLQTGVSETGASGQLYQYLLGQQNNDQSQVSSAIQNFVSSLGGGSGNNISLSLGKI